MVEASTLHGSIARLFAKKMSIDVPSLDTDLFETGVLDSMAFVELLAHLEGAFGLKVSVEDMEIDNFRSIRRIAEFVTGRGRVKGAA